MSLSRLLREKTKAGDNVERLTRAKALTCVEWSEKLVESAPDAATSA